MSALKIVSCTRAADLIIIVLHTHTKYSYIVIIFIERYSIFYQGNNCCRIPKL